MFGRSRGFEYGPRTPHESRVTETRQATLKYDVGKPLLLSAVSAIAAVVLVLSILWAVKAMGRHVWYVIAFTFCAGLCVWEIVIGRRYDAQFGLVSLMLGIGLGLVGCIGGVALDLLVTHYWAELLLSVLPLTFAATFAGFVWLPNFLEAVLVSPHLEQALAILIGGHDDKYTAPWWLQLFVARKRETQTATTQQLQVEATIKDEYGRVKQILNHLMPPVDLDKFTGVVRKVIATKGQSYSEALLCGNGNPLSGRPELDALRDWFIKYEFAKWKSVNSKGKPNKRQSIVFTQRGMEILTEIYNAFPSPTL